MLNAQMAIAARWCWLLAVHALLVACAATTVDATWTRPGFAGRAIEGPVLVVGVVRDDTVRRIYEDDMAARLAARGIKAVRSYEVLPSPLQIDSDTQLVHQARKAGARYLLSTAVIGQTQETVVTQDMAMPMGMSGFGGWYSAHWRMSVPVRTDVRTFTVFIAQSTLFSVADDQINWTARTSTTAPSNVERETRGFVDVILGAMTRAGLLPPAAG